MSEERLEQLQRAAAQALGPRIWGIFGLRIQGLYRRLISYQYCSVGFLVIYGHHIYHSFPSNPIESRGDPMLGFED